MNTKIAPKLDQVQKLNDLGMALAERGKRKLAIIMLKRARALMPDMIQLIANLGVLQMREGNYFAGYELMERAVKLAPNTPEYLENLGICANILGRHQSAQNFLINAIQTTDKENYSARWHLALSYLREGRWTEGLALYESRILHRGTPRYPNLPVKMWAGEDLNDKTIYIHPEQGIGDRILFSRYLAWMKEKWPKSRILTCMPDSLMNLFWCFQQHGIELLPPGIPWPKDIDYGAWLCSLPMFHGTTPTNVPPDPGWIRERLEQEDQRCRLPQGALPSLKVGICYTGSPMMSRNEDRSIPLDLMLELAIDPRVQLYNFQCGPGHTEFTESGAEAVVADLAPDLEKEGLVGTALALREMDVVVTVCTSIAHLCGALGVPCLTLLCADPYWIWGTEEDSTPWYPGMKLLRQRTMGDWSPVILDAVFELNSLLIQKDIPS